MDLITDRREAPGSKLFYGCEDLNRVEAAVAELSARAKRLDIHLALSTKTDWGLPGAFSPDSWPVRSQMQRYLSNIAALGHRFAPGVELPQSMDYLNIHGANSLEKALLQVEKEINGRLNTFRYSGEIFAGEENGV